MALIVIDFFIQTAQVRLGGRYGEDCRIEAGDTEVWRGNLSGQKKQKQVDISTHRMLPQTKFYITPVKKKVKGILEKRNI